jgi:shikimate dehydrogenase
MTSAITGRTTVCGVIGDPVDHSMSPAMHNAAFRKLGLDFAYLPFRVLRGDLGRAIDALRALHIRGLNVTIPHKVAVMPLLDRLDPVAERIGAVNTIVNENGVLTGYNTDAGGFLKPLEKRGVQVRGKSVAMIGAGGAARAIAFALVEGGAHLVVLNRSDRNLAELCDRLAGANVEAMNLDGASLRSTIDRVDVLVNATPVGMTPAIDETPVAPDLLRRGLLVYDIVYNPPRTRLLTDASAAGGKTIGGLDMLVWQAALAFEKWTGQPAPVPLMKSTALRLLRKGYED